MRCLERCSVPGLPDDAKIYKVSTLFDLTIVMLLLLPYFHLSLFLEIVSFSFCLVPLSEAVSSVEILPSLLLSSLLLLPL